MITTKDEGRRMKDEIAEIDFREQFEQFRCANEVCDGPIPPTHVHSRINKMTGIRTVRAICPACKQMREAHYRLRNGTWELISQVKLVTDEKTVAAFRARVELLSGEVRKAS